MTKLPVHRVADPLAAGSPAPSRAQPRQLGQRPLLAEHPDLHRAEDRGRDAPRGHGDAHPVVGAGPRRVVAARDAPRSPRRSRPRPDGCAARSGRGRVPGRAARRSAATAQSSYGRAIIADCTASMIDSRATVPPAPPGTSAAPRRSRRTAGRAWTRSADRRSAATPRRRRRSARPTSPPPPGRVNRTTAACRSASRVRSLRAVWAGRTMCSKLPHRGYVNIDKTRIGRRDSRIWSALLVHALLGIAVIAFDRQDRIRRSSARVPRSVRSCRRWRSSTTSSASCRCRCAGTSTSATCNEYAANPFWGQGNWSEFIALGYANPASSSQVADYTIINVILLPLFTIIDGRPARHPPSVAVLRIEPVHQLRVRVGLLLGDRRAATPAPTSIAGRSVAERPQPLQSSMLVQQTARVKVHHLNCGTMYPFGCGELVCHVLLVETDNGLVLDRHRLRHRRTATIRTGGWDRPGTSSARCSNPRKPPPIRSSGSASAATTCATSSSPISTATTSAALSDFPSPDPRHRRGGVRARSQRRRARRRFATAPSSGRTDRKIVEHDPRRGEVAGFAAAKELVDVVAGHRAGLAARSHAAVTPAWRSTPAIAGFCTAGTPSTTMGRLDGTHVPRTLWAMETAVAFDRKKMWDNHARLSELYNQTESDLCIVPAHDMRLFERAKASAELSA